MTASMHALVRRMAARVSGCPERVLVNSAPEFSALRMAWRERSAAHAGEGRWNRKAHREQMAKAEAAYHAAYRKRKNLKMNRRQNP